MTDTSRRTFLSLAAIAVAAPVGYQLGGGSFVARAATTEKFEVTLTPAQWKARLTPAAFSVLREENTETPFTSALNDEHRVGTFACAGCALPLFASTTKFDSGTGWPSFWKTLPRAIGTTPVSAFGQSYSEVHCRRCGGHLGHVFNDGPRPTGLRYCMNGVALHFTPSKA